MTKQLTKEEQHELERCEVVIKQGLETFIEVGQALMTIRDKRLYRLEYTRFEDYCRDRWGMTRMRASQLINAADVIDNLNVNHGLQTPTSERQARPLTKLEPEIQREAWAEVTERHKDAPEKITAKEVEQVARQWQPYSEELKQAKADNAPNVFNPEPKPVETILTEVVQKKKAHMSNNSGNNEWYTPGCYIESARTVMGSINLDPASSVIANEAVKAETIYTAEENGLEQKWFGNIWMNPPYAQPLIQQFCEKLATENYNQAIVLVNNATETKWGNRLLKLASAVCFPKGRIRFVAPDGTIGDSPLQGQMIVYIGTKATQFHNEFEKYGPCLEA
jgi:hypothetical protein